MYKTKGLLWDNPFPNPFRYSLNFPCVYDLHALLASPITPLFVDDLYLVYTSVRG